MAAVMEGRSQDCLRSSVFLDCRCFADVLGASMNLVRVTSVDRSARTQLSSGALCAVERLLSFGAHLEAHVSVVCGALCVRMRIGAWDQVLIHVVTELS